MTAGRASIAQERPTFLMEILPGADTAPLTEVFEPVGYRDWLIEAPAPHELEAYGVAVDRDGERTRT